jgi:hypothetical protein
MRRTWIELGEAVAVAQQCVVAAVCRATISASVPKAKGPTIDVYEPKAKDSRMEVDHE